MQVSTKNIPTAVESLLDQRATWCSLASEVSADVLFGVLKDLALRQIREVGSAHIAGAVERGVQFLRGLKVCLNKELQAQLSATLLFEKYVRNYLGRAYLSHSEVRPAFTTRELVDPRQLEEIVRTLTIWQTALSAMRQLLEGVPSEEIEVNSEGIEVNELLDASSSIVMSFLAGMWSGDMLSEQRPLYVTYDEKGVLRGIALVWMPPSQPPRLRLLAVDPRNLNLLGVEGRRIKGAGTATVRAVAGRVLAAGHQELFVDPLPCSASFYQKLGFTDSLSGSMRMDAERLRRLYEKYGPPSCPV